MQEVIKFRTSSRCGSTGNDGDGDCGCVEFRQASDGVVTLRDTQGREVVYDNGEWSDFIAGVKAGEFEPLPVPMSDVAALTNA